MHRRTEAGGRLVEDEVARRLIQLTCNNMSLVDFLARLVKAIEEHNWDLVLMLFGEKNFRSQRDDLKISKPQYIIEGLDLGFIENSLRLDGEQGLYTTASSILIASGKLKLARLLAPRKRTG